ncbi:acyl carrier protein [Lachnospiraceae bacterium LCP25S3_G4]
MEKLLEILEDIKEGVDFKIEKGLIDNEILDSFDILSIVGELEEEFEVDITPVDIVPKNFNSADALWDMVQRLQSEN